jgi:hypothetical protein
MSVSQQRMAAIFNEWARRYAAEPQSFGPILDSAGKPVSDYGECAAAYFSQVEKDMDAKGQLPEPVKMLPVDSEKAGIARDVLASGCHRLSKETIEACNGTIVRYLNR